tara:strand:- start:213 stop:485 length:273 start_codon:yes stop_codon:yes gene_type:complete
MKVENMTNNNGNKIVNQFIIYQDDQIFFQSYNTMIAMVQDHYIELDANYWNYSKTTSKYRNQFLNMTTKEIENAIKNGLITLTDLNHEGA